jgi:dihydroxy-acid dehydratase
MKKKSSGKKSRITHHASPNLRPFSSILVDGPERAAARAMLYPVGFKEEDFKKPICVQYVAIGTIEDKNLVKRAFNGK